MGSAPHQGACADLDGGCTWACRRLRRACSCSVRVSSATCGVHCASTSNVLHRASTGTNVLGASACRLCRTYCYRNRWLRFSPCRVHRLRLHLWWSTSRRHQQFMLHLRLSWCTSRWHKQCLTPRKHKYWSTSRQRLRPMPYLLFQQLVASLLSLSCSLSSPPPVVEYITSALAVYVAPALVVVYIAPASAVYETPVVEHFAPVPSVYRQHQQCTKHLLWCTSRWHQRCTLHLCLS